MTWTADAGAGGNTAAFEEPSTGDLAVYLYWGDPVEYDDEGGTNNTVATDCEDNDATGSDGVAEEVLCTGINTVTADGGAGGDFLTADGWWSSDPLLTILATFNGGLGEDDLDGGHGPVTATS